MISEGRYVPPEARKEQFTRPTELTSEEDLTQFWLTFRRNNGLTMEDLAYEKQLAALQAKNTIRGLTDNPAHFFGVKDGNKMVATGKLEIRKIDDEKHGYLAFLTVDESHRGAGLAKQLTDARTETARREGCTHIDTDVFTENPIALVTKFNDGYTLTNLDFYGDSKEAGSFVLSKRINGEQEHDIRTGPLGELQEVPVSDLSTIKSMLENGWVGIDVKNIGDAKDRDPKQWTLIMEQTTKKSY